MTRAALRCLAFAVLATCGEHRDTRKPETHAEAEPKPRLVVLVVIDQLPSWSFDVQKSQLDRGIARLLAHGVYWPHARYPYAATHTAPGHATIGTGAPPSVHGIVANRWIDPQTGELREVDEDPSVTVLDPRGGAGHARGISNAKL